MMWARLCEIGLGLWVIATPWVLGDGRLTAPALSEIACGTACVIVAAASCLIRSRPIHLLEIPIALWLVGFAYATSPSPASATAQSDLLVAFFLVNFAIIPTRATTPPPRWREAIET